MKAKQFLVTAVLATAILCLAVPAGPAKAACSAGNDMVCQINGLKAQIEQLSAELPTVCPTGQPVTEACLNLQIQILLAQIQIIQLQTTLDNWCYTFTQYLITGSTDATTNGEVSKLQVALAAKQGFTLSGDDNGVFGEATAAAVVAFQTKYGITPTGTVGPITRGKLNEFYGCSSANPLITNIGSPGNPDFQFYPGDQVTIGGSNFPAAGTIQMDRAGTVEHSFVSATGNATGLNMTFTAPSIPSGTYRLYLVNGQGGSAISNTVQVTVLSAGAVVCTDTDGGVNYSRKGTTTDSQGSVSDYCSGTDTNLLYEFFCDGDTRSYTSYTCPNGCDAAAGTCKATQPSITVTAPVGGEVLTENSKVVDSLSSVDSPKQIFEIKWTGAPDSFEDVFGSNGQAPRIQAYLQHKINGQYKTAGRIMPQAYGSIMWIIGEVSNTDCTANSSDPKYCYNISNMDIVAPGYYAVKIVDMQTGTSGQSKDFTLIRQGVSILRISAMGAEENQIYAGEKFAIEGWNFYKPDDVYVGNKQVAVTQDGVYQSDGVGVIYAIAPSDLKNGDAFVDVVNVNGKSNDVLVTTFASTQPSITVTSPNNGEKWVQGKPGYVAWSSTGLLSSSNVEIILINSSESTVASTIVPNSGSYSWAIASLPLGDYKIQIRSRDNYAVSDTSDNYFSIVSPTPSIKVTFPDGGQLWQLSTTQTITWESTGVANVGLHAQAWPSGKIYVIDTVPASRGSYSWTVGKYKTSDYPYQDVSAPLPAGTYKIYINGSRENWQLYDASDGTVNISSSETVCTDSDGGTNYDVKGNTVVKQNGIILPGKNATDYCTDSKVLMEYACNSSGTDAGGSAYSCPNGCLDGACVASTQQSITVVSPNGGETWAQGMTYDITWKSSGINNVSIYLLYETSGSSCYLGSASASQGKFTYMVGTQCPDGSNREIPPGSYRVLLSGRNSSAYNEPRNIGWVEKILGFFVPTVQAQSSGPSDGSDNYFKIVSATEGGYDACRLDKLDGTNITRDAIAEQSSCLSKLCDVYGPANLANGLPSKCVFKGTEIKRYESVVVTNLSFAYGLPNWLSIAGDWNADKKITIGLYDPVNSVFYLKNSNGAGYADITFAFGSPSAGWKPIAGDWNGDGTDSVGLYDPKNSIFYLKNINSAASGHADITFGFGGANWKPIAGDWNNDGIDTIGLYDPVKLTFYLRDYNASSSTAEYIFGYGEGSWTPIAGDWDGDGKTTIGLYDPSASLFYLRNSNTIGHADWYINYGSAGAGWLPVVGDWDGDKTATPGVYDPITSTFYLKGNNTNSSASNTNNGNASFVASLADAIKKVADSLKFLMGK